MEKTPTSRQESTHPEDVADTENGTNVQRSSRDTDALITKIFTENRQWLTFLAMQQGCQYHDAEDVVQDSFASAWKNATNLRGSGVKVVCGWIKKIVTNHAINLLQRRPPMPSLNYISEDREEALHYPNHEALLDDRALEVLLRKEWGSLLKSVLPLLREISRNALEDFYYEKLTILDMCKKRRITASTAKRRLFDAREQLRDLLGKYPETAKLLAQEELLGKNRLSL